MRFSSFWKEEYPSISEGEVVVKRYGACPVPSFFILEESVLFALDAHIFEVAFEVVGVVGQHQ
jgi:hypothetical protein